MLNTSVPLKLKRGGKSDPIECKQAMALQRVKTHTTHIADSGTDANLDMKFRVVQKVGNETKIVGECESLRLNNRCTRNNCHEKGNIENYYISHLGKYLIKHVLLNNC